jgi:ATP-dependent protease ClpP protease subunit
MPEETLKLPFFISKEEYANMIGRWHSLRRVLIEGNLNGDSIKKAFLELLKLDHMGSRPITLMIQSGGGGVTVTHQFEDTLSALNSPVDGLVIGDCASMAVDLLQMCRRRYMLPSSRMLVHYIRNDQRWICDDLEMLDTDIKYFKERNKEIAERRMALYMKRSHLPRKKITELFRQGEVHEAYFSAKQAVELGLADKIITNFKFFPRKLKKKKER